MPSEFPQSIRWLVAGMAFCMVPSLASVAARAAGPATAPESGAALDVVVLEVKGTVQASTDDGKTWLPAKPGLHLSEGASFRTGFRSSVTCGIPPDQGFTLESLGTVRVDEAIKKGKKFKTNLVMKYGATNYSIETGGAEHETTIRTPGSTLSVRGTIVRVTDRPGYAPTAESFTGRAVYKTRQGITTVGSKGGKYARVSAGEGDAANTALSQTVVDPAALLARTATDAQLIAQQTSLGALVSFDTRANIAVVRNSAPLSDAALVSSLPGTLDFVLRWTGNADLNLEVDDDVITPHDIALGQNVVLKPAPTQPLTPIGLGQIGAFFNPGFTAISPDFQGTEFLYPGFGLNVSPTGGVIPYDNRGGPKGGMELAYWQTPPQGIFGVQVLHVSGGPANFQVNVYQNGKPLNLFYATSFNANGSANDARGVNQIGTLSSANNHNEGLGAVVFSPANSYFDTNPRVPSPNTPSLFADTSSVPAAQGSATPAHVTASSTPAHRPANAGNHVKSAPALAPPASPPPRPAPARVR